MGVVLDMGLSSVDVTLQAKLQPLVLRSLTGRLAVRQDFDTRAVEVTTTQLEFETHDGVRWPGGNLWLSHKPPVGRGAERGAIKADRLDLAMLAQIANRLPLGVVQRHAAQLEAGKEKPTKTLGLRADRSYANLYPDGPCGLGFQHPTVFTDSRHNPAV